MILTSMSALVRLQMRALGVDLVARWELAAVHATARVGGVSVAVVPGHLHLARHQQLHRHRAGSLL